MSILTARDVLELAHKALLGHGFPGESALEIAQEFVTAELAGVKTHGVGKLISLNFGDLGAKPTISSHGALLTINGNGGNGFLLMRQVVELVAERCMTTGVSVGLVRNFSRYGALYPYTSQLARKGFVSILANSAGPPAVAPFGSTEPLTGTNPLCFSFPTLGGEAQTFDLSTSDHVWGEIRQAALEGRSLPSGPFLDAVGDVTTAPSEVNAVRAFGGAKGWSINLAIEILAGVLAAGRAGSQVKSEFDCGAILIAIDPQTMGSLINFSEQIQSLMEAVRSCRPENPEVIVRCPGDRGKNNSHLADRLDHPLEIPTVTLEMMTRMSKGERVSDLVENPLYN